MKLLFEEYSYPTSLLQDIVGSEVNLYYQKEGDMAKIPYVGYYFNGKIKDSIFILPKVFISENNRAFDRYNPETIVDISPENNPLKAHDDDAVVFELSAWLYQAISHYYERKQHSNIGTDIQVQNIRPRGENGSKTIIEIILSLLDYNNKHKNLFTYISLINASGNNKIHWAKTISKVQPLFKNNTPYYLEFKNKNKVINYDEELISLFYSVLNYLSASYHFRFQIVHGYSIEKPSKIQSMIESGKGTRLLKRIRRNYYTDELVELWHLMHEFFQLAETAASGKSFEERLLVSNFNLVFEDMIDQLISDSKNEIPNELREQLDGKVVDHIYKDQSLLEDRLIYYIGDSKYYKETTNLGPNSIYKQYTYAKNVIQYNINLFNSNGDDSVFRYRDTLTEGYNITPNFFIRGIVDFDNPKSLEMKIEKHESDDENGPKIPNIHFFNRLFDRDTLFLQSYNINFMFVIAAYVQNSDNIGLKKSLQTMFRLNFMDYIKEKYEFYTLKPIYGNLEDAVNRNFKLLNGKIYKPTDSGNVLIMALDNNEEYQTENMRLINAIQEDFLIGDYELGTNPNNTTAYPKFRSLNIVRSVASDMTAEDTDNTPIIPAKYQLSLETILLGVYKNEKHKEWILTNKRYNVRLGNRAGAVKKIKQVTDASYLVLYDFHNPENYSVYKLSNKHHTWNSEKMRHSGYPLNGGSESNLYYIYELLEKTEELGVFDLKKLLERKRAEYMKDTGDYPAEGAPIYLYKSELIFL